MTRGRAPRVRWSLPWMLAALLAAVMVLTPAGAFAASNNYTVKFAANGGTGKTANQSIARDKSVKLRANGFSRNAYVYTGWNTKANGKGKAYKNQAAVKNLAAKGKTITLYAQWRKAKNYTVVFNANGGTGSTANQGITYNTSTKLRANGFSRELYTFTGWNTQANGGGKAYGNTASVRNIAGEGKTITLYAQWKAVAHKVVFNANGGEGTVASQIITNGKTAKLRVNAFTRQNYAFTGWNTEAEGTGADYENKEVLVEDLAAAGQTITLYAQWEPTTYQLNFDANGGVGAMGSRTVTAGKTYRLPVVGYARAGYIFEGWSTDPDGSGEWYENREIVLDDIVPAGEEVTLYAQWKPTAYLVAYDANGGEGTMDTHQANVGKRVRLSSMAFTYAGHSFTGWCTEPDGSGDWYLDGELVADLAEAGKTATLYAQWQATSYTVAFDANGGTGTMADVTAQVNKLFKLPTVTFAREGYTFAGWNTAADGSGVSYDNKEVLIDALAPAGETVTLYAQWREVAVTPTPATGTYTIAYDANGGAGTTANQTLTCGKVAKLAACGFTREGFTFTGWNTAADGSGTAYDAKEVIVDDLAAAGETITLYAKWREVSQDPTPAAGAYTIAYDLNGAEGSVASRSVQCGSVTKIADAPTRDNHEFLGWNTAADGSGTAYDAKEVIVSDLAAAGETITLYAQWKAVSCTIVFDANGGEGAPEPIVVDTRNGYMPNFSSEVWTESFPYISLQYCPGYDTSSFLHEPTREGYLFAGWAGGPEGTVSHINVQGLPGYNLFEDSSVIDDLPDVFYDDGKVQVRVVPGQTVTVYATWSQDPVTVIVDANGGSLYDVDDPDGEALSQCEYTVARTNPLSLPYVAEDGLLYLPNGKTYRVTSPQNGKTYMTWIPLSPTPDDSEKIWFDSYYGYAGPLFGGSIAELFPNAGSSATLYLIWNEWNEG